MQVRDFFNSFKINKAEIEKVDIKGMILQWNPLRIPCSIHELLKFDERHFFHPFWDYQKTEKAVVSSTTSKQLNIERTEITQLNCNCFDGSFLNGSKQPISTNSLIEEPLVKWYMKNLELILKAYQTKLIWIKKFFWRKR